MGTATLTGDFGKLKHIASGLRDAANLLPFAADAAGAEAKRQYLEDFSAQRSPAGAGWAPTQKGGEILFESGALANDAVVSVSGGSVSLNVTPYYGRFHQGGWETGGEIHRVAVSTNIKTRKEKTKKVRIGGKKAGPARPILPAGSDLGVWEEPLQKAVGDVYEKALAKLQ